jgi:hypothetical protein
MLRLVLASLMALAGLSPVVGIPEATTPLLRKGRPMKWFTGIGLLLAAGALTVTIVMAQDKAPDKPIGTPNVRCDRRDHLELSVRLGDSPNRIVRERVVSS